MSSDPEPERPGPEHHRKLENLYHSAPVTELYGARLRVGAGRAEVTIPVRPEFFHAAAALHGSVYFRALDDAAFFAANSAVDDALYLTRSFEIRLLRPVDRGELRAVGRLVRVDGGRIEAEAEVFASDGELVGTGSGVFARSDIPLGPEVGYR
ncbi:MAG TPA: PaaI family thioesterase [Longimicrobiales bacterium]|nr:PaaI family thioesterase [Longimicrobiales bacterium]